jgi:DNA-binding response OmpR family regulator
MSAMVRLAVFDSESGFVRVLKKRLDDAGWEHRELTAAAPLDAVVTMRVNAVILDPEIVGPPALAYVEQLRARCPQLGIVVCTGPSSVGQRVRGLRAGADDWVTKPCHPLEVIARVEAVTRRRRRADVPEAQAPRVVGELEIRADLFQALVGGAPIDLTRREFELLELLARAEGQVLERDEIYERVWGYALTHGDRSVDVYVRKLRRKLAASSPRWRYIHTHFGIGYRLACEPAAVPEPPQSSVRALSRRPDPALAVATSTG